MQAAVGRGGWLAGGGGVGSPTRAMLQHRAGPALQPAARSPGGPAAAMQQDEEALMEPDSSGGAAGIPAPAPAPPPSPGAAGPAQGLPRPRSSTPLDAALQLLGAGSEPSGGEAPRSAPPHHPLPLSLDTPFLRVPARPSGGSALGWHQHGPPAPQLQLGTSPVGRTEPGAAWQHATGTAPHGLAGSLALAPGSALARHSAEAAGSPPRAIPSFSATFPSYGYSGLASPGGAGGLGSPASCSLFSPSSLFSPTWGSVPQHPSARLLHGAGGLFAGDGGVGGVGAGALGSSSVGSPGVLSGPGPASKHTLYKVRARACAVPARNSCPMPLGGRAATCSTATPSCSSLRHTPARAA